MGTPLISLGNPLDPHKDNDTIKDIIEHFKNHPSIIKIRQNLSCTTLGPISLPLATKEEINKILKDIDTTKSCGPDKIPPKIAKISADILDTTLVNIINDIVLNNKFSENAKNANVPPIYKKSVRSSKLNYRPVSLLNIFSKVLERWTKDKIKPFVNEILTKFI